MEVILVIFVLCVNSILGNESEIATDERYQSAVELYNDGEFEDALSSLRELIKVYPDSPRIHRAFGHVYAKLEDYRNAVSFYEIALKLGDNFNELVDMYVYSLQELGENEKIVSQAERFLQVEKMSPFIVRKFCEVCVEKNDALLFRRFLKSFPEDRLNDIGIALLVASTSKHLADRGLLFESHSTISKDGKLGSAP